MRTRFHLTILLFLCLPIFAPAQQAYYFIESSCKNCKHTANGQTGHFAVISHQVHPFTMEGNDREIELITADYKTSLATRYSNYPALIQNVQIKKYADLETTEQARQLQKTTMKKAGYQIVEHPFWFVSHRAIPAVDEYLSFAEKTGFEGVVLIAENDWIIHKRGYGMAQVRSDLPNSPHIAFPIGEITKSFTAQAILLLHEAGKLKLSNNLGKIFKKSPSDKKTITINQLLTHTSGLEDTILLQDAETGKEVLDAILKSKLQSTPGEKYQYSDAGYQLLALIIQKITRQPYDQFLKEQILLPFQLRQTCFSHQLPDHILVADGKMAGDANPFTPVEHPNNTYLGSQGLIMTADDLFRWFKSLCRLPFFFEMSRPRLNVPSSHGFTTSQNNRIVFANGSSEGYHAHLSFERARNRVIIVLANSGLGQAFHEKLAQNIGHLIDGEAVKQMKEYPLNASVRPGFYVDGLDTLQVFVEEERLKILASGQRVLKALFTNKPTTIPDEPLLGFALPKDDWNFIFFDLPSDQGKTLLFSENFRQILVGYLKLERVDRP